MRIRFAAFIGALPLLLVASALAGAASAEALPSPPAAAHAIHITGPTADRFIQSTSTQVVSWNMLPAVSSGEFHVSLVRSAGTRYIDQRILPVADRTSYSTAIAVSVPAGSYRAQVSWRPAVDSGSWEATDTSAAFTVRPASLTWTHALQIIANLRAHPPRRPLVLLLGGSTVRESTISDASFRHAIERRLSGRRVTADNIASSNEGFNKELALVPFIPPKRAVVFIGVNLSRFISPGNPP